MQNEIGIKVTRARDYTARRITDAFTKVSMTSCTMIPTILHRAYSPPPDDSIGGPGYDSAKIKATPTKAGESPKTRSPTPMRTGFMCVS